ncbi:MAG: helix-turn-helix domain-containing protein [Magnetococcales bacterium]|nr:helix-turn-helix domain-containing protein [Magnetococcales bacterium]
MSRTAKKIVSDAEELRQLEALARSKKSEFRLVERARMVLACLAGEPVCAVADRFQTSTNTVIAWRDRFEQLGVCGLTDMPRSGRPAHYAAEFRESVLQLLGMPPPAGQGYWNGVTIAKTLQVSDDAVSRLLRKEGIQLRQQRNVETNLALAQNPSPA